MGFGGNTNKAVGPGSVSGHPGASPMISQNESGDQSATTRSAISAGAINVTNGAGQTQDVANLSRDTTDTNGTVAKTSDVNAILNQQADTMQAAQAAGQVVSQGIGAYAESKLEAAQKAGDAAGEAAWDEGGTNRTYLHIAGGALMGGLGGGGFGSAFAGAAGAGVSAALAPQLNSLSKGIADSTGSTLLGNLASNVLASAGGALVGGSAGAFTAANADLYNRQLHPKEETLADRLADESGGKYTAQQIEDQMAQMNLTANGQTESGGVRVAAGDQPNDGTTWTPYGVNQAGQQVWAQSLGAGDPNLQAYIVNGAQGSGFTYQATTIGSNPGVFRLPDMVNFQVDYFVGSVWGTFTRDGSAYFGGGLNMNVPNPVNASAGISAVWLNSPTVKPGQANDFAGGYAGGLTGAYDLIGGGLMYSPGNGTATAIGVGAGLNLGKTTNVGTVGGGYSVDQGTTGMKW
ncbi:hypothetical protein OKW49_004976 [Paraburkholderia youngii]